MAKGKPNPDTQHLLDTYRQKFAENWDNELCAEHDGSIASFDRLSMRVYDIKDYDQLFKRDAFNLLKAGKIAGGTAAVAGIAALAASGAAPVVAAGVGKLGLLGAAGTGTAITTLNGAALASASLAAIGGSVATGTAIVSAVGVGLGGSAGAVLANKYHGDDPSFNIKKLLRKNGDNIIFINGFTQEKEDTFHDWISGHITAFPREQLYGLNWASKTRYDLGKAFGKGVIGPKAKIILEEAAKKASKEAAKKLNPLALLLAATDLMGNPWHVAMSRAGSTGAQLADAISRTPSQEFTLVGHSLGCRVIYYALEALSTKKLDIKIKDVILLGGAVGRDDDEGWKNATEAISGKIFNCYSENDSILNILYKYANLGFSDPIGARPITLKNSKIKNINCSSFVDSHMTWKDHYEEILYMIYK